VRSHAKALSAVSTVRRAMGPGRAMLGALVAITALMGLIAAPASALKTHFFLEDFGSAAQPSFINPIDLAVDQSNGDVLVADVEAGTVSRYKADGTPDDFSALGTNVIDGVGPEDETPQAGLQFNSERKGSQIAIDNSGGATDGDIYVATGSFSSPVVDVFSPSGAYLGQLSEFKEGADASGALTPFVSLVSGVAVGPDSAVYVGDYEGYIHKYAPGANPPVNADNVANFSYPEAGTLAVGRGPSAGFLFANTRLGGVLSKLDASTGEFKYVVDEQVEAVTVDPETGDVYAAMSGDVAGGGFRQFDASGASSATLLASVKSASGTTSSRGIAVSGADEHVYISQPFREHLLVYGPLQTQADIEILPAQEVSATRAKLRGTVNPDGAAITGCKFEYGTVESGGFAESAPCEESIPTDATTHTVSAVLSGLPADGAAYHYRLVVTNSDARTSTSDAKIFDLPLRVLTGGPTSVFTDSATVTGAVRPEGEGLTGCRFEYGPTTAYGLSVPCSPDAGSIPADFSAHAVSAELEGLQEFTPYHYRLSFTTLAGAFSGKDEVFRTLGPSGLADGRRYEQVSPVDKNGSDIEPGIGVASVEGNRLVTRSIGGFAGSPTALLSGTQYLSTRGTDGWSTEGISLPGGQLSAGAGYEVFTPDLSKGVIKWPEDTQIGPHDPDAVRGNNFYLRDTAEGSFALLNGTLSEGGFRSQVLWGSDDFSHLVMASHNPLTPEAAGLECNGDSGLIACAYEWDEGTLRLASIVNGEPVEGSVGSYFSGDQCAYEHAMSGDGARLFFTSPLTPATGQLYARENGATTTPISESERTLPGGLSGQSVYYQNAEAEHGNRVLFTTRNSLLDEDTDKTNDLYLYDYAKPAGERLTLISEDENPVAPVGAAVDTGATEACGGVLGASEDLRRVYFVADNQIIAGQPEEEGPKLYLWDDSGASPQVSFIATLKSSDNRDWQGALNLDTGFSRRSRLSADGRYLVFLSTAQLTGFDNEGRREVYRYDAATGTTECASCSADASPAEGAIDLEEKAFFNGAPIFNHVTTNVTEKGQVFFQTTRGLIPADSNGQSDVYEYENGRLSLISSGEGAEGSYFLDATPSGSDVFFTTKDRLVGWDKDGNADAYDAREGGGFPEPPSGFSCEGDSCQPAPNPPNDATPASAGFKGQGNVSHKARGRCAKGKARRHGRCVKRHAHKQHKAKRKTSTPSHG
jgi:hypothetical protein